MAAAAIDVYTSEPPAEKGNPLLEAPNIVLTPHLGASTIEAQIGVSVDVAKGIIAALHGEPVATAVNMAPVSPQVMRVIAPYLTLAERLGGTVVGLAEGPIEKVEVTYNGEITEVNTGLLTTAVIKGILNPVMENEVNYVNAPGLAKERGIKVSERKEKEAEAITSRILSRLRSRPAAANFLFRGRCSARRDALSASMISASMLTPMPASSSARISTVRVSSARSVRCLAAMV